MLIQNGYHGEKDVCGKLQILCHSLISPFHEMLLCSKNKTVIATPFWLILIIIPILFIDLVSCLLAPKAPLQLKWTKDSSTLPKATQQFIHG